MGRPTKPVAAGAHPRLRAVAAYLRQLKDETRTTYATLSERTGPPNTPGYRGASTLSQAARGTHLPPLETVLAYARAAGDPGSYSTQWREAKARSLWKAAAIEKARPHLSGRGRRARQVRTPASLGQELTRLRLRAGRPSYNTIEHATKADGHRVPRSTAHLIGKVLPSREQLSALLKAFDVSVADAAQWHAVLDRIEDRRRPPEPLRRGGGYVCADADPAVQEYLERRERDEEIKRRTGQIHPDETYEDYEERMRERAFQQAADDWLYDLYEDDPEGDDEAERQTQAAEQAAEQAALRAPLKVVVERVNRARHRSHLTAPESRANTLRGRARARDGRAHRRCQPQRYKTPLHIMYRQLNLTVSVTFLVELSLHAWRRLPPGRARSRLRNPLVASVLGAPGVFLAFAPYRR